MATFGKTDIGANSYSIFKYECATVRRQAPEDGVVTSIWIYIGDNKNVRVCMWDDLAGVAKNMLGESGDTATLANQWNKITGFNIPITKGAWYWFGVQQKETAFTLRGSVVVGGIIYKLHTYGAFSNPFPAGYSTTDIEYSIYAEYTPSGGASISNVSLIALGLGAWLAIQKKKKRMKKSVLAKKIAREAMKPMVKYLKKVDEAIKKAV